LCCVVLCLESRDAVYWTIEDGAVSLKKVLWCTTASEYVYLLSFDMFFLDLLFLRESLDGKLFVQFDSIRSVQLPLEGIALCRTYAWVGSLLPSFLSYSCMFALLEFLVIDVNRPFVGLLLCLTGWTRTSTAGSWHFNFRNT